LQRTSGSPEKVTRNRRACQARQSKNDTPTASVV
jgi:hypothetical protein